MRMFSLSARKEAEIVPVRSDLFNLRKTDSLYSSLLQGLRAKVEYKIDMVELRVLAVTSAVAGEGKTLTAVNLAINMASTGRKRVLLMDMDLRKSGMAEELRIDSNPGLGDFLLGAIPKEKIFRKASVPGLFVIPGGGPIPSPTDMLAGDKFRSLMRDLREQFDLVILDTPPILPVPDALTISEQVDSFILLFRLNQTPHALFRQAVEELGERKIMGVVLNGEDPKPDKYYSRYYGKYYKEADAGGNPS